MFFVTLDFVNFNEYHLSRFFFFVNLFVFCVVHPLSTWLSFLKVPLSSVIGTTGRWGAEGRDPAGKAKGAAKSAKRGIYKPTPCKEGAGGSGGPSCAGSRARAAEAAVAEEVWDRLTLKARVFCRVDKKGASVTGATSGVRARGTAAEKVRQQDVVIRVFTLLIPSPYVRSLY